MTINVRFPLIEGMRTTDDTYATIVCPIQIENKSMPFHLSRFQTNQQIFTTTTSINSNQQQHDKYLKGLVDDEKELYNKEMLASSSKVKDHSDNHELVASAATSSR